MKKFGAIYGIWVLTWVGFYLVLDQGNREGAPDNLIQRKLYSQLVRFDRWTTDAKFRFRGSTPPKNRIVIVEIDSPSIEQMGRWPWRRDFIAYLIHQSFEHGAKLVGLDILFSEPQATVPPELEMKLQEKNLGGLVAQFDYDLKLQKVFSQYKDKLVPAFASESVCVPRLLPAKECPVSEEQALRTHPENFPKFAIKGAEPLPDPTRAAVLSAVTLIPNTQRLTAVSSHVGFVNAMRDTDGIVRNASLAMLVGGRTSDH